MGDRKVMRRDENDVSRDGEGSDVAAEKVRGCAAAAGLAGFVGKLLYGARDGAMLSFISGSVDIAYY